jgi:sRNA-binding carbon storage regulator CsrA
MLIITRREKESFCLLAEDLPPYMTVSELFAGGHISVTVTKISRSQVKLNIEAPKDITIRRDDAKQLQKTVKYT